MLDNLESQVKRFEELNELLITPEVTSDPKQLQKLSKERSALEPIVEKYNEYKKAKQTIEDNQEIIDLGEGELSELAQMENDELVGQIETLEEELKVLLLPKDPADDKDVIVEIRGAAGGDEAALFAEDLLRMYRRYAENNGYKVEVMSYSESEAGGAKEVIFMVKGTGVYSKLKFESGSHRVQRVPATESQGRIHTSTATVLVMPEVDEFDVEILPNEIKIDTFRSGGAGGQSVNTTDSAVRITHVPTGIMATSQDERDQHTNKDKAMKILQARVYDHFQQEAQQAADAERMSKLGTGDRSEKIRTYNYPQNRVTDHRIGLTVNRLTDIMEGKLELIVEPLIEEDIKQKMEKIND